jgi:hypothetical protein
MTALMSARWEEMRRPRHALVSLGERLRRGTVLPRQRAEGPVPGPEPASRDRPRPLEPQNEVHRPLQAPGRSQQHPLGAVVYRRPLVRLRPGRAVPPRAHEQDVADDHPARRGTPRGVQDHRSWQVPASRRDHDLGRPEPEPAGPPGPASRRTRWARPPGAGTSTPRCRSARRAPTPRSQKGSRNRQWEETGCRPPSTEPRVTPQRDQPSPAPPAAQPNAAVPDDYERPGVIKR